ncbi:diguanylate cyclase [Motilimonas cestriensis]|uniref:diguanylate cyclase n=1 Tax=Motilimonas cestriensis TaxID=2742685 RepID=A0ABS8W363_9GAMM|nr:sensor domain-containing diguanylate cyclase [Motilimonas cestriensis]MCE2593369.1 diguanylate cyclase [Motilimonas cestriensis]
MIGTLIAIGIVLFAGAASYHYEKERIKQITKETLLFRIDSFEQYLHLMSASNIAMRNAMRSHYQLARQGDLTNHILDSLAFFEQYQVYSLPEVYNPADPNYLNGTLTIAGEVDINSPNLRHELTAAISLNEQLAVYVGEAKLALWTYYISKQKFVYILPKLPLNQYQFSESLYLKPFWQQLEPQSNPEGRQMITDLYEDSAGQGLMVTIASPVYYRGDFLGVICVDVGIDYLQSVLRIGEAVGESVLIDENGLLVATAGEPSEGKKSNIVYLPTAQQWLELDSSWVYAEEIKPGELYFVHSLAKTELMLAAIRKSLTVWLLLLLGCVLSYLAYSQYCASVKHRQLMLIDPLTKLYNRRGLEILVTPIYAHLARTQQYAAILLIDIDKFKQVNDTYGHGIGDEVLKSTAKILNRTNRKSAICARWGGEEFMVFLQAATPNGAMLVAERIRQQVENNTLSAQNLNITISVGIAVTQGEMTFEMLVEQADSALYQAKQNGRNQSVLFTQHI